MHLLFSVFCTFCIFVFGLYCIVFYYYYLNQGHCLLAYPVVLQFLCIRRYEMDLGVPAVFVCISVCVCVCVGIDLSSRWALACVHVCVFF